MKVSNILTLIIGLVAIAIFVSSSSIVAIVTDWLWFSEVGFTEIFYKAFVVKISVGVIAGVSVLIFLLINFLLTVNSKIPWMVGIPAAITGQPVSLSDRLVKRTGIILIILLSILIGLIASSLWQDVLKFMEAVPFDKKDPLFNLDIGFYVFKLPIFNFVIAILKFLCLITLAGSIIIYTLRGKFNLLDLISRLNVNLNIKLPHRNPTDPAARLHIGILIAFYLLLLAVGTYLSLYNLIINQNSLIFGATFTDTNLMVPLIRISAVVYAIAAFMALIYGIRGNIGPLIGTLFITLAMGAISVIVPSLYQRLVVAPNELVKETPFIKYNIEATRHAYGLDKVEEREIATDTKLTAEDIEKNNLTIKNVRLWDRDPLLSTFSQIQEIRTYYEFESVDNDRYYINDEIRQIMLSPRELASSSLPNRNWINEHLTFTHGYGITAGPVNQVTPEGLPVLFVKDIPPKSTVAPLDVKRPEIYFGELANDFIFVNTNSKEFDYPKGDTNVYTDYKGKGGVTMDSIFKRLLFAMRFGSLKILLSEDVKDTSRILYNREIKERVAKIAPFLTYDLDPYIVVADGRLYWILDAYTSTDSYPYSQQSSLHDNNVNYVRNSVKAVVDAYNGSVNFYTADADDPIIKTYAKIFPNSFKPISAMPKSLAAHIRYPEDIFSIQTAIYMTYHMKNPQNFYNKEDQWEIPAISQDRDIDIDTESTGSQDTSGSIAPRHLIMKLPGEKTEEFILMLPFTPRAKDNLSAWMVARNDGANFGKLLVYSFPKDKLIFGPKQIIGRINQDAEVSRQISLWDQGGSQVIQGPLLVIPIENSLLYVRPLYLKAETGKIPELKRVIVAYENKISMEQTLEQGLAKIFGSSVTGDEVATEQTGDQAETNANRSIIPDNAGGDETGLLQQASNAYEQALNAQRNGDWARYGEEIKNLGDILNQMNQ